MGSCLCRIKSDDSEIYMPGVGSGQWLTGNKFLYSNIVDHLVLEMLSQLSSFIDNTEGSPAPLAKLHAIADKGKGWIQVVKSLIEVIPLEDPHGPSTITVIFDDCPLPSRDTVIRLMELLDLSKERALDEDADLTVERNICIVVGCIAEKLAGPNSIAILTESTLDYLLTLVTSRRSPIVVLFALIALEKFAHTTENKSTIHKRLVEEPENPLLIMEKLINSNDLEWRQVGFCAQWALDNIFVVEGRTLSYETVDMSKINVILNTNDVSQYLKISCDGLEARCDSQTFESVRSTFQVDKGCWYYECTIITPGVMQIGWATKGSNYQNHDGYGIGDDLFSLSYDGCRRLIWHKAKPSIVTDIPQWQPGDVLGCLLDIENKNAIFSLNGQNMTPFREIFESVKNGFFAAASFTAFQQCRFNFGNEPFVYSPDAYFTFFNMHASLTEDQKMIIPRRLYQEEVRRSSISHDSCTICYDKPASCILEPCLHGGFCPGCTTQLKNCPLCRGDILNVRHEEN